MPLLSLTPECRVHILNFLEQGDLMNACLVSKQFHDDCWHEGIADKIIPIYEITPRPEERFSPGLFSTIRLIRKLCLNQVYSNHKFARYHHVKVNRVSDFGAISESDVAAITCRQYNTHVRLESVVSLDISLPAQMEVSRSAVSALLDICPNLREFNLSNTVLGGLLYVLGKSSFLEKVTWNRSKECWLSGHLFHFCNNLKELILDDSEFPIAPNVLGRFSGAGDEAFIFSHCKSIERLSIRNARWYDPLAALFGGHASISPVPQEALIKFVRNAPRSLRWFRSDLTKENISMLRMERPEIEILN